MIYRELILTLWYVKIRTLSLQKDRILFQLGLSINRDDSDISVRVYRTVQRWITLNLLSRASNSMVPDNEAIYNSHLSNSYIT